MTRGLVVGAGSIGIRHGEVLTELGVDVSFVTQRTDIPHVRFSAMSEALTQFNPDYVIVANETARHSKTLEHLAALGFTGKVLAEKPLASSGVDVTTFSAFGVGYNLRFHPLMSAVAAALHGETVLTVEVYAGQHLSTWRPNRGMSEQYSGYAEMGGGALRDLSHELDYLDLLLGKCTGVFARGGRLGEVTVDSDDAWGIVASYKSAPLVTIQLNYLDTQARRRVVANIEGSTIEADFIASTLQIDDSQQHFANDRNETYRAMHTAMIEDNGRGVTTWEQAVRTDALIVAIERSASELKWLEP